MRVQGVVLITFCGLMAANAVVADSQPVAVSSGDSSKLVLIGDAWPTFSWTAAPGAERYELVIYAVGEGETESTELLRRGLPRGATSWTPSLDECLGRNGRYAWSVRAVGRKAGSDWSAPSLFQVAAGPSAAEVEQALAVLRQYLATPGARAPEGAGAVARPITTRAEEAAPAGSAAVEPRAVPTTTGLQLSLGGYQGGTAGSVVAGHKKQMIIAGEYNEGTNIGSSVKLLISDYDNQTGGGSDIYPIYVEDENNFVDFYVRKQEKKSSAYFGGDLHVQSDVVVGGMLDIGYRGVKATGSGDYVTAHCPVGKTVLGGGCKDDDSGALSENHPSDAGGGWVCSSTSPGVLTAYVLCANIQ